ncbi:GD24133 [Drosophila simulans]|uniref:GD24133 n=1 Tax=Drosophila simulans TaxID=7240 RepID=B4Q8E9_DROSI|nr:GD24133 [Drosophila simulans]
MDCLQQVGVQQLGDLKRVFTREWPKYCKEYYCLDTFLELYKKDDQLKDVQVYALPNLEFGIFVIVDHYQIFVGYLEAEQSESLLKESLLKFKLYGGEQFASMPKRYFNVANDIIQAKNLKLDLDCVTLSLVLSKEEALLFQVEAPAGFSLKPVDIQDAQVINDQWEWSEPDSFSLVHRQILYDTSVGLYTKENKELVAWCIRRQEALLGRDTITEVVPENKASLGLFTKLGFKINDQCHWLMTEPPKGVR